MSKTFTLSAEDRALLRVALDRAIEGSLADHEQGAVSDHYKVLAARIEDLKVRMLGRMLG
jgi:hypothetical protein